MVLLTTRKFITFKNFHIRSLNIFPKNPVDKGYFEGNTVFQILHSLRGCDPSNHDKNNNLKKRILFYYLISELVVPLHVPKSLKQ